MVRAAVAAVAALLLASCTAGIRQPAELGEPRDEPRDGVVRIRGTLEDSETDTGRAGEVRAYRREADGSYTLMDADATDGAGNFALSFPDGAGEFDLQARLKDGAADAGYVRTITLPMRSASGLLVRAVPYTGLNGDTIETDITIERFREHIIETLDGVGLLKWRNGEPKGIEVLHEYTPALEPVHSDGLGWTSLPGSFTQDQLAAIEDVLRSEEGRALVGGREITIQIDGPSTPDSEKHYSYYEDKTDIKVDDGWIVIFPSAAVGGGVAGFTSKNLQNHHIYRSMTIVLRDDKEWMAQREKDEPGFFRSLVLHELGHATFDHTTLDPRQSIMIPSVVEIQPRCLRLCFADRKALKIAWEETLPPRVRVGDVLLGLQWHD